MRWVQGGICVCNRYGENGERTGRARLVDKGGNGVAVCEDLGANEGKRDGDDNP